MFVKIIVLLALFVMELGVTAYFLIKKKIKWFVAVIIFFALVALVAGFLVVPAGRAFFNIPVLTTRGAAELFCSAVNKADFDSEAHFLKEESTLYSSEACSDATAEYLRQLLLSNITLEVAEEPEMGWECATVKVRVSYPDICATSGDTAEAARNAVEEIGAQRPRSLVYSADKKYLPEIIYEAYQAEVEKTDSNAIPVLCVDTVLSLVCEEGNWYVVSDRPVLDVLLERFLDEDSLIGAFDSYAEEQRQLVSSEAKYVEKHFTINFSDTVAPEPDKKRFGITTDPAEVQAVVEQAADLLKGQELVWNPDIVIYPGTDIRYYFDDTILTIVWREERNGTLCTFADIKLADASQFRRKLVDDTFNPPTSDWIEATVLSQQVNAVLATGSDLYAFRNLGLVSYDGILCRCNTSFVESCHVTRSGDLLFTKRYELLDWDEAQQWLIDNDIMFSFAFGPRLVENGEPITTWEYCIGEIWEGYARAAIGQLGEPGSLHYLMTVMSSDERVSVPELPVRRDPTLLELRDVMVEKGCSQAYTLDGGQTGAIIIDNEMITRPTYGWERIYCDIIYFATALTPEERLG